MTNPIAKRLDRLEAHVGAKVGKGFLRFGNKTYSRCISIIVHEDEDEDQIIAQKRASGENDARHVHHSSPHSQSAQATAMGS